MIINQANLSDLFKAYNAAFNHGFTGVTPMWGAIATEVPSGTRENHYAWLGQFPMLREWVGDRVVKSMAAYDYTIQNKKFESTVGVPRDDIEDDTYGVFTPLMRAMGHAAATHPDQLIWPLLGAGNTTACYDGQYFFDNDHPVGNASVSNINTSGSGTNWFLLDLSQPLKPLILQRRRAYDFRAMTNLLDSNIFETDVFKFGVDGRLNAGFGFWQQAYASNQVLESDTYAAAWAAMSTFKGDQGQLLGIKPTHMVVGPSNRAAALSTIEVERLANGASNPFYKTVQVVVSPYLP